MYRTISSVIERERKPERTQLANFHYRCECIACILIATMWFYANHQSQLKTQNEKQRKTNAKWYGTASASSSLSSNFVSAKIQMSSDIFEFNWSESSYWTFYEFRFFCPFIIRRSHFFLHLLPVSEKQSENEHGVCKFWQMRRKNIMCPKINISFLRWMRWILTFTTIRMNAEKFVAGALRAIHSLKTATNP